MAYRAIQDNVGRSVSLARLSHLAERLYWRLLGTCDPWGRLIGHPAKVRAQCFPMLSYVSDEAAGAALQEMADVKRVQVYESGGEAFIQILEFEANQPGEVYRKRRPSKYPDPPDDPATETGLIPSLWNTGLFPESPGTPAQEHVSRKVLESSRPEREGEREREREREVQRPSSYVARETDSADGDDDLLNRLKRLNPTPAQWKTWTAALEVSRERVEACLIRADEVNPRIDSPVAYFDTLIKRGDHPDSPIGTARPAHLSTLWLKFVNGKNWDDVLTEDEALAELDRLRRKPSVFDDTSDEQALAVWQAKRAERYSQSADERATIAPT